ncbi:MAG: Maf family protein [Eubacteriales bacterium]|nr:Maf family protein [Eubacteriales bacterium]
MRKIILASASPRRRELLANAGVIFQVCPGNSEEKITKEKPEDIVKELSLQKAMAVASRFDMEEGTVILGADTIVSFDGRILGKPENEDAAVNTLTLLQGKTHQVYTGVTIMEQQKDASWKTITFSESTDVSFYPVSEDEIRRYVATGEPMDKAGSYGIQGGFGVYVKEIRGDYTNVVGLPVGRLFYESKKHGIELRG